MRSDRSSADQRWLEREADMKHLFDSRPIMRTCSCCNGRGSTSGPYFLRFSEDLISGVPADVIPAVVVGCASIFNATCEAADIARRGKRSVAFDFNGKIVVVKPGDDANQVARAWWADTYGETLEQSAACR